MEAVAGQIATNKFFPSDTIHTIHIYIYISRPHRLLRASPVIGAGENRARIAFEGSWPPSLWCSAGKKNFFGTAERKAEFRDIVSVSIPPIKRHVWSGTQLALEHGQKPRRFGYLFSFRKVKPKFEREGSQHLPVGNYRVANGFWQFIVGDREDGSVNSDEMEWESWKKVGGFGYFKIN